MRILQVALLLSLVGFPLSMAQGPVIEDFEFVPPVVEISKFGEDVNMLTKERDEYARNLAIFAGNLIAANKANEQSLDTAKRMLTIARHLSPKNRTAIVLGFQLKRGVLPEKKTADYTTSVLSRLLLSRSRLLTKEKNPGGLLLARCFIEIAATIDPRNEDAVYEFEIQRIDNGEIDWKPLFESRRVPEE